MSAGIENFKLQTINKSVEEFAIERNALGDNVS